MPGLVLGEEVSMEALRLRFRERRTRGSSCCGNDDDDDEDIEWEVLVVVEDAFPSSACTVEPHMLCFLVDEEGYCECYAGSSFGFQSDLAAQCATYSMYGHQSGVKHWY